MREEWIVLATNKYHLNFVDRLKMRAIEGGDTHMLIDLLSQKGVDDQHFLF